MIQEIAKYIEHSQLTTGQRLNLTVNHGKLGTFQVQVLKNRGHEDMRIQIKAFSDNALNFFNQKETQLVNRLAESGLNVGELKITAAANMLKFGETVAKDGQQSTMDLFSQREQQQGRQQQSQQDADSQRRRDLWEQYRERYGA